MKFAYIDKLGSTKASELFIMASLLIDTYRLRFNQKLAILLVKHPGAERYAASYTRIVS
jgi:hypothetical protein